jgi:hypothetical protein
MEFFKYQCYAENLSTFLIDFIKLIYEVNVYVYVCVYMYIYMCVCVCVYIYM